MAYDVIGDVHGQDGKLEQLLQRMGYVPMAGATKPRRGDRLFFWGT